MLIADESVFIIHQELDTKATTLYGGIRHVSRYFIVKANCSLQVLDYSIFAQLFIYFDFFNTRGRKSNTRTQSENFIPIKRIP